LLFRLSAGIVKPRTAWRRSERAAGLSARHCAATIVNDSSAKRIRRPFGDHSRAAVRSLLRYLAAGCVAMLLAGCKSQPYVNAHIESVNAEYRQLEDYVYALEEENGRLCKELEAFRAGTATTVTPTPRTAPATGGTRRPSIIGPRIQPSTPPSSSSPEFQPPTIEIPGDTPPAPRSRSQRPADQPPPETAPSDTPPSIEPLPLPGARGASTPSPLEAIPRQTNDKKVTHLFLNPQQTRGADFDGQPGDDGLRIVVEPRNAGDEFVSEAGTLSVVVLDPERQGDEARIARWDFDQSATRQMLAASSPKEGIKVEVPWPAAAPNANRLKLYVRYETADGRRLQADRDVFVTPPGQAVSRWTPRPSESDRLAERASATVP
jgi:hypothetical protein